MEAGLYLKVSQAGGRSWIQRITVAGRRRDLGVRRFPDVGLAQAREAAAHNRTLIAAGTDPLAERRRAAIPTFREAAEQTFKANTPRAGATASTRQRGGGPSSVTPSRSLATCRSIRSGREVVPRMLSPKFGASAW